MLAVAVVATEEPLELAEVAAMAVAVPAVQLQERMAHQEQPTAVAVAAVELMQRQEHLAIAALAVPAS